MPDLSMTLPRTIKLVASLHETVCGLYAPSRSTMQVLPCRHPTLMQRAYLQVAHDVRDIRNGFTSCMWNLTTLLDLHGAHLGTVDGFTRPIVYH